MSVFDSMSRKHIKGRDTIEVHDLITINERISSLKTKENMITETNVLNTNNLLNINNDDILNKGVKIEKYSILKHSTWTFLGISLICHILPILICYIVTNTSYMIALRGTFISTSVC